METGNRIPKTIHYCWFGGNPLPELAERCIESWRTFCPDYEIVRWDETNFDIHYNDYVAEAYAAKKWAFVSDVARLYALVHFGGIYMDTDVEVLKPLDELLQYEAVSGFESADRIPTGLMACRKQQPLFEELLRDYEDKHFLRADGSCDPTTNVTRITNLCEQYGLRLNNTKQTIRGFTLLPTDVLCPKDYETGELHLTNNSLCIHHFDGSWHTEEEKYIGYLQSRLGKVLPWSLAGYIAKTVCILKHRGGGALVRECCSWLRRKSG